MQTFEKKEICCNFLYFLFNNQEACDGSKPSFELKQSPNFIRPSSNINVNIQANEV